MDRTQTAVERRQDQMEMLARLHLVMERTFSNLVMQSSTSVPTGGSGGAGGANQQGNSDGSANLQRDAARNGVKQAEPRPRLMLEVDAGSKSNAILGAAGKGNRPQ